MTLKEKFNKISCSDCDMPFCDIQCTMLSEYELNHLEKIADEFAIGFAEWVDKLEEKLPYLGIYEFQMRFGSKTFKELLEIYKKKKVL